MGIIDLIAWLSRAVPGYGIFGVTSKNFFFCCELLRFFIIIRLAIPLLDDHLAISKAYASIIEESFQHIIIFGHM